MSSEAAAAAAAAASGAAALSTEMPPAPDPESPLPADSRCCFVCEEEGGELTVDEDGEGALVGAWV